jgi:hypothetical protein
LTLMRTALPWLLVLLAGQAAALDDANAASPESAPVIPEDQPLQVAIAARNPNDRAVRIAKLDSTCSCTHLKADELFILPHATTTVQVTVDNHNRSGPQRVGISAYLSDPDLEPIELTVLWTVRPAIAVDLIDTGADPLQRPADNGYRDVYRFVSKARPDETAKLKKRIRLSCPPEETPAGGLQVLGIDYAGDLWRFDQAVQADGSVLVTATARDPDAPPSEGLREENATVRTNHPRKPTVELRFIALIAKDAGTRLVDPDAAPGLRAPVPEDR